MDSGPAGRVGEGGAAAGAGAGVGAAVGGSGGGGGGVAENMKKALVPVTFTPERVIVRPMTETDVDNILSTGTGTNMDCVVETDLNLVHPDRHDLFDSTYKGSTRTLAVVLWLALRCNLQSLEVVEMLEQICEGRECGWIKAVTLATLAEKCVMPYGLLTVVHVLQQEVPVSVGGVGVGPGGGGGGGGVPGTSRSIMGPASYVEGRVDVGTPGSYVVMDRGEVDDKHSRAHFIYAGRGLEPTTRPDAYHGRVEYMKDLDRVLALADPDRNRHWQLVDRGHVNHWREVLDSIAPSGPMVRLMSPEVTERPVSVAWLQLLQAVAHDRVLKRAAIALCDLAVGMPILDAVGLLAVYGFHMRDMGGVVYQLVTPQHTWPVVPPWCAGLDVSKCATLNAYCKGMEKFVGWIKGHSPPLAPVVTQCLARKTELTGHLMTRVASVYDPCLHTSFIAFK
jgi:hypothetical protein